jgi:hypothetical protein
MAEQSKLENIFSYSFPANHLLQVSIVKQVAGQSYKREHFCFITLAPGVQSQQGGRSFDFNNRVTMKVDGHQVIALAHAVRAYARNQIDVIGPFSIYVDSSKSAYGQQGQGGKSLFIQRSVNQKQSNAPVVAFFFKTGQSQALGISMSPPMALAAADVFEFIGKKCLDLEYARGPVGAQTGAYQNPGFASPGASTGPSAVPTGTGKVADNFAGAFDNFIPDTDVPF